jgi:hypothetical protein
MEQIIVTTQAELNAIPAEYKGLIIVRGCGVWITNRNRVEAWGNSSVEAWGNSSVVARGNSSVVAWGNSSVVARGNSSVVAWGNSSVEAWGNSSVVARENSSVEASENSSVVAWGNSSVVARENSSVVARENSSVVARENSSVEASENSSVEASENSSVVGSGNVQIVQYSNDVKLAIKGNARIAPGYPQDIANYLDFYGLEARNGQAILYKSVRSNLASHNDPKFQYEVGKEHTETCDQNTEKSCSNGLHVSHLAWAIDFGRSSGGNDFKILECAVPIDKIVLPKKCDGKVRTSELTVLREVPPSEWGLMGTILGRV